MGLLTICTENVNIKMENIKILSKPYLLVKDHLKR